MNDILAIGGDGCELSLSATGQLSKFPCCERGVRLLLFFTLTSNAEPVKALDNAYHDDNEKRAEQSRALLVAPNLRDEVLDARRGHGWTDSARSRLRYALRLL